VNRLYTGNYVDPRRVKFVSKVQWYLTNIFVNYEGHVVHLEL